jgi:hypothetical protein
MEVFDETIWTPVGAPPNAGLGLDLSGVTPNQILKLSVSQQSTPPTPGTLAAEAINGSLYWDDVLSQLFIRYANGGNPTWVAAAPSAGSLTAATLAEAKAGTVNLKYSSPETSVPKNASGMLGSAFIPAGSTADRPAANTYTGQFRYNTQTLGFEYSDGSTWLPITSGSVTTFSGGTTGLTPAAATGGAVTLAGTLAIANGGTGATSATDAINNLLPTQGGNSGRFLTTNGTNVSWAVPAAVTSITAGTGLSGGTITTSGTIGLANTAVTAGSYLNANITVDAQGRLTSAANGALGGTVAAWVAFSSIGSISIFGSGNVSSVTSPSTGVYLINFTVSLGSTNYAIAGMGGYPGLANGWLQPAQNAYPRTATQASMTNIVFSGGLQVASEGPYLSFMAVK